MEIKKLIKRIAVFLGITIFCLILFRAEPKNTEPEKMYVLSDTEVFSEGLEWELVQTYLPVYRYMFYEENGNNGYENMISSYSPLYRYLLSREAIARGREKRMDMVIGEEIEKQILKENAGNSHNNQDEKNLNNEISQETDNAKENSTQSEDTEIFHKEPKEEAEQQMNADIASVFLRESEFEPNQEKKIDYDWKDYTDIKKIREDFFAVDATTEVEDEMIQPEKLMEKDILLSEQNGGPQILIYHTHSQESFADSIPGDENTSIVGAGEYLTKLLREKYGFEVLHHTGEYDVETRDYAYSYALPNIEAILSEYPSIEVVIDLHRDAVAEDRKLVSEQNGKQAAQIMFFNGLSYTKKQGDIAYLENPYIEDNLAFSFQMQVLCNEYYPGLTRRIYLKGYRYNMHLCPQSLLIELGAQTNTCEEVKNTLDILAHVLSMCLDREENNQ